MGLTRERFEVRLAPPEAAEVHARMRHLGVSSKADYVRSSILGLGAADPGRLDDEVGQLGLCLSQLIARASVEGWDTPAVRRLIALHGHALRQLQDAIIRLRGRG